MSSRGSTCRPYHTLLPQPGRCGPDGRSNASGMSDEVLRASVGAGSVSRWARRAARCAGRTLLGFGAATALAQAQQLRPSTKPSSSSAGAMVSLLLTLPRCYRMALRELNCAEPLRFPPAAVHCPSIKPLPSARFLSVQATRKEDRKRIGVIGGGTAGIGSLIGILDVPAEARASWSIELLEKRDRVGGLWYKDPNDGVRPPTIPQSPAYPLLHTNTVSPSPHFRAPSHPLTPTSSLRSHPRQ